jgi:hypothetical protein
MTYPQKPIPIFGIDPFFKRALLRW